MNPNLQKLAHKVIASSHKLIVIFHPEIPQMA